eukprot:2797672-Rhodomonas_salina.1
MGSSGGAAKTGFRGRRTTVQFLWSNVTVLVLWSMTAPTPFNQGIPRMMSMPLRGRTRKETAALYCWSISIVRIALCETERRVPSGRRTEQGNETGTRVAPRERATS